MALAFSLPVFRLGADQIIKTDGTTIDGHIVSVSGNQVMVEGHTASGGDAKFPVTLTDIDSVKMAVPAEVAKVNARGVGPGDVIAILEPATKQFAGLPADWVVEAMARLGEAYTEVGEVDKALAIYNQISRLYAGSAYENVAKAGEAELNLETGKIDEALAAVQPIVEQANKDIAPSPADGALYAHAFLVYGRVLEAQKKPQQALEAYLTVKTMFYQNAVLMDQADQLANNLRTHNPGLGVE